MPNNNILEDAEAWCAVESTDDVIREVYTTYQWMLGLMGIDNPKPHEVNAWLRAEYLVDQQIMAFVKQAGAR